MSGCGKKRARVENTMLGSVRGGKYNLAQQTTLVDQLEVQYRVTEDIQYRIYVGPKDIFQKKYHFRFQGPSVYIFCSKKTYSLRYLYIYRLRIVGFSCQYTVCILYYTMQHTIYSTIYHMYSTATYIYSIVYIPYRGIDLYIHKSNQKLEVLASYKCQKVLMLAIYLSILISYYYDSYYLLAASFSTISYYKQQYILSC